MMALAFAVILAITGSRAGAQITLGSAGGFAVLGSTTVTNTGLTSIVGDLGVSSGALTGFPPGVVTTGTIHVNDSVASQALQDAATAYAAYTALPFTQDLTGQDLGGLTLTPGVYRFSAAAILTGTLTLDGLGQANPLFVFQIGSTLTTAAGSFNFVDGATASSVNFLVGSSATLGSGTLFAGTIIASVSDTLASGVELEGRVIALTGAVTLDSNQIALAPSIPEPASTAVFASGLALLLGLGRVIIKARRSKP